MNIRSGCAETKQQNILYDVHKDVNPRMETKMSPHYSTTNKMHLLSQIIRSCKTLYMFRTVFPSIIMSSKLRIQQRYMWNSCCHLLLAAGSSSCL